MEKGGPTMRSVQRACPPDDVGGIEPLVGSRGNSYENALAETINGPYKAALIHRRAPSKTKEAVGFATV